MSVRAQGGGDRKKRRKPGESDTCRDGRLLSYFRPGPGRRRRTVEEGCLASGGVPTGGQTGLRQNPVLAALLAEVELEISSLCKTMFDRAYILCEGFQDCKTACKIYELVIALPAFDGNDYPDKATRQLEKLRKQSCQ